MLSDQQIQESIAKAEKLRAAGLLERKGENGESRVCALFNLFGCDVWVPCDDVEPLNWRTKKFKEMSAYVTNVVDQLQKMKELADQIAGEFT